MAAINTSKRLGDVAKVWVIAALKEFSGDDQVTWELSVNAYPDPSTVPSQSEDLAEPAGSRGSAPSDSSNPSTDTVSALPVLVLYLEIPGSQPETSVYSASILTPFGLKRETVFLAVDEGLRSLRAARKTQQKP